MIPRLQKLSKTNSLFLFGARGTGKSTLLRSLNQPGSETLWIDLLSAEDDERYCRTPQELSKKLDLTSFKKVIIDEVQKAPKLLDIVHLEIEKKKGTQFFLTGSSARKLKRGGGNLLAGRAFTFKLFPLTYLELASKFNLDDVLMFGTLPKIYEYTDAEDKTEYLRSYSQTYLREEIQIEQLIRNLNPFRDFLELAAQNNGEIINYSNIARDIGVDHKTVSNYYQILEDTLLGFFLAPYHKSVRKRQIESPKFYLFDLGVKRSLERTLNIPIKKRSYAYGAAFEHFIILEITRLNEYFKSDFKLSYLKTKDGAELDLIIERPAQVELLIEVKSTDKVEEKNTKTLLHFQKSWARDVQTLLISNDLSDKLVNGVECLYWERALEKIFTKP